MRLSRPSQREINGASENQARDRWFGKRNTQRTRIVSARQLWSYPAFCFARPASMRAMVRLSQCLTFSRSSSSDCGV